MCTTQRYKKFSRTLYLVVQNAEVEGKEYSFLEGSNGMAII